MKNKIREILEKENIVVKNISIVPVESGQKIVYFIETDCDNYVLKLIDVTPSSFFEEVVEITEAIKEDIMRQSYRINEEIKFSKRCPNFPQIIKINGEDFIKCEEIYGKIYLLYLEERFEGDNLNKELKDDNKEFNINEVLNFLLQMAKHIKIISENGYVHRDIKPDNIIVNKGIYSPIDGGICKDIVNGIDATVTGSRIGTRRYLAPEQEKIISNYKWTFQTDLYPLGIVAVEMLNSNARANYTNDEDIRDVHVVNKLWLEKDDSEISQRVFKEFVQVVLSQIRAIRFQSIDECIKKLEDLSEEAR